MIDELFPLSPNAATETVDEEENRMNASVKEVVVKVAKELVLRKIRRLKGRKQKC